MILNILRDKHNRSYDPTQRPLRVGDILAYRDADLEGPDRRWEVLGVRIDSWGREVIQICRLGSSFRDTTWYLAQRWIRVDE